MKLHFIAALTMSAALACGVLGCTSETPPEQSVESDAPDTAALVALAVEEQRARFDAARPAAESDEASAYQFEFEGLSVERVPMTAFEGEVVLIVNTASKCGFTPQYEGLQEIYAEYRDLGFEVLGVPSNNFNEQEPGTAEEIREFCSLNFGVTFPMAGKTDVIGDTAHPFYRWAHNEFGDPAVPQWNFHKILINREGQIVAAFPSATTPTSDEVRAAITAALGA